MERASTAGEGRSLTVVLDFPDHRLTLNQVRMNPQYRIRLKDEHKSRAQMVGLATVPQDRRPWFPAGVRVVAWCEMERNRGGQRWDFGGVVEALKPAYDGLKGTVWADDKQLAGMYVLWDEKPTGAGIVKVTFKEME